MNCIETHDGRVFDYEALTDPAQINLQDIASSLSKTCRYGGFCKQFYSVAEHAVLVARILRSRDYSADIVLAGLHHDSHEAYLGDAPTPLKREFGEAYVGMARAIDLAIESRFEIPAGYLDIEQIKQADADALRWESYYLKDSHGVGEHWGQDSAPTDIPYWFVPGLQPAEAKRQFISWHLEFCWAD